MKLLMLVLLTFASTSAEAMDTRVKCRNAADQLMRSLVASPVLDGSFSTPPSYRLQRRPLPDNESEFWEHFTYNNGQGDNSVTIKLARGLCELREVIHNVPL
jgi:hypothetical protein